jgi:hypothetical protein
MDEGADEFPVDQSRACTRRLSCLSTSHPVSRWVRPRAIQNAEAQIGAPATLIGNFQGNAQAF